MFLCVVKRVMAELYSLALIFPEWGWGANATASYSYGYREDHIPLQQLPNPTVGYF